VTGPEELDLFGPLPAHLGAYVEPPSDVSVSAEEAPNVKRGDRDVIDAIVTSTDYKVMSPALEPGYPEAPPPLEPDLPGLPTNRASNLTENQGALFAMEALPNDSLAARFVEPPFSVLDGRQGRWTKRKREWMALGIRGEQGRGDELAYGHSLEKYRPGMTAQSSVFDPVLCELVYRWFTPGPCHVLDPFAGEATKGLVACKLGHQYTGIELRPEQVRANQVQAHAMGVAPNWIVGDSADLARLLPPVQRYGLLFTSPPYYDLEEYQGGAADGSGFGTYEQFMSWYEAIFRGACARLQAGSFCVVKVGEIRDKKTGAYRDFVGDNVRIFRGLGLHYYNTAVLLTPVGSMPVRATRTFGSNRKLVAGHQNLLVFYFGNLAGIGARFSNEIQYGYEGLAAKEGDDGND
jgi:DNA modification methylase